MAEQGERRSRDGAVEAGPRGFSRRHFLAGLGVSGGLAAVVPGVSAAAVRGAVGHAAKVPGQTGSASAGAGSPVVLSQQVRSVRPGELFNVTAAGVTAATQARLWVVDRSSLAPGAPPTVAPPEPPPSSTTLAVVSTGDDAVAAVVPQSLPYGWYALYTTNDGSHWSAPYLFNQPDPWYLLDRSVTPGGSTAVFGQDLVLAEDGAAAVALVADGQRRLVTCPVTRSNAHAIWFGVPRGLERGIYQVWVGNGGAGGALAPGSLHLEVTGPTVRSVPVYDVVARFGADPTGTQDSTQAIQSALDAATSSPQGATVVFPAGTYTVSTKLQVGSANGPVILRGAGATASTLVVSPSAPYSEPEAAPGFYDIYGSTADDPYGIVYLAPDTNPVTFEQLGFDCNANRIVAVEVDGRDGVTFDQVAVEAMEVHPGSQMARGYFAVLSNNNKDLTIRSSQVSAANGLFGVNTVDIRVVDTQMILAQGGPNQVLNAGVQIWGGKRLTVTGCTFDRDPSVGYYNAAITFGSAKTSSATFGVADTAYIEDVYVGANTFRYCGGPEQNNGSPVVGDTDSGDVVGGGRTHAVSSATTDTVAVGATTFDTSSNVQATPIGAYVFIVDGTGTGQVRKVVANTATTLQVESPWDVVPDTTSSFVLQLTYKHNAYVDNVATQAQKYIGIFCSAFQSTVSGNRVDGADAITPDFGTGTALFPLINADNNGAGTAGQYPEFFNTVADNRVNLGSNYMNAVSFSSRYLLPDFPIARGNAFARNVTTNAEAGAPAGNSGIALTSESAESPSTTGTWAVGTVIALDTPGTGTPVGTYVGMGFEGTLVQGSAPVVDDGAQTIQIS